MDDTKCVCSSAKCESLSVGDVTSFHTNLGRGIFADRAPFWLIYQCFFWSPLGGKSPIGMVFFVGCSRTGLDTWEDLLLFLPTRLDEPVISVWIFFTDKLSKSKVLSKVVLKYFWIKKNEKIAINFYFNDFIFFKLKYCDNCSWSDRNCQDYRTKIVRFLWKMKENEGGGTTILKIVLRTTAGEKEDSLGLVERSSIFVLRPFFWELLRSTILIDSGVTRVLFADRFCGFFPCASRRSMFLIVLTVLWHK